MPGRFQTTIFSPNSDVGNVLPLSTLDFFEVGSTTTRKDTFTDNTLLTPHTNPVVADGDGRFAEIWLSGGYRVVFREADATQVWDVDEISSNQAANTTFYNLGKSGVGTAAGSKHEQISTGHIIETNYIDSNLTPESGSGVRFTGTTTAGKAGNWPNADGFFYDADGKQFANNSDIHPTVVYGALLDGSDDTSAIQAAIIAAERDESTAELSVGTSTITASLNVTSPLTLQGLSWGSELTCAAASTFIFIVVQDLVTATPLEGVILRDFKIDANASGQLDAGIIQANNAIIRASNLRLKDGSRASAPSGVNGIAVSKAAGNASSSGVIENCLLTGFSKAPINVASGSEEFLVIGNTCHSNTGNGQTPGIQVNGGLGSVKVIGNTVYSNEGRGILIGADVGALEAPIDMVVADNTVYDSGTGATVGDGITVVNGNPGTVGKLLHLIVSNNTVRDNGLTTSGTGSGINIQNMQHISILGNRIYGNGVNGIEMDTCDDVLIEGNAIYNNNQDALTNGSGVTVDSCTGVTILSNSIYDAQAVITQDNGIFFVTSTISDVTISDNAIGLHDVAPISGVLPVPCHITNKSTKGQTTDATPLVLWTMNMPDGAAMSVKTRTLARETDGTNRALYEEEGLMYLEGGAITIEGAIQSNIEIESDAAWDHVLGVGGGSVFRLIVTGAAATIDWTSDVEVIIQD